MRTKSVLIMVVASLVGLILSGCATPETMLKDPSTGKTVECGGGRTSSILGGVVGYEIAKHHAHNCVQQYMRKGYKPAKNS